MKHAVSLMLCVLAGPSFAQSPATGAGTTFCADLKVVIADMQQNLVHLRGAEKGTGTDVLGKKTIRYAGTARLGNGSNCVVEVAGPPGKRDWVPEAVSNNARNAARASEGDQLQIDVGSVAQRA